MVSGKGLRTFLFPHCPFFYEAFTSVCELPQIIVQFPCLVFILSLLRRLPILSRAHTRNQKMIGKISSMRILFFHVLRPLSSDKWLVVILDELR